MDMVDEEHSQNEEIVSGEEGELKEEAPSPEVSADDQGETGPTPIHNSTPRMVLRRESTSLPPSLNRMTPRPMNRQIWPKMMPKS
jgi:hypothetical protein